MYHHFKGTALSRSEHVQRLVVEKILMGPLNNADSESSRVWELKHSSSCVQIGRMLALKRGLSIEFAEIICVLHDIAVIETGHYIDHAAKGAEMARKILSDIGQFTPEEILRICDAIAAHSDKQGFSANPYAELVKDADVYDCSLYEGTAEYYKTNKSPEALAAYKRRAAGVAKELSIPPHPFFIL